MDKNIAILKIKVHKMVNPRSGKDVANQFVITTPGAVYFQSYKSIIAVKDGGNIYLDKFYWDYSRTTMKYLALFPGMSPKEIRKAVENGEFEMVDLN